MYSIELLFFVVYVTYWPSTQPSIKEQVHTVEDIKI